MGNTVVLTHRGGTEYTSEEEHSFRQNEFLISFKLVGEAAIFLD